MGNLNIDTKYYIEDDVLLVHKPVEISSFGLVLKLRKLLNTKKIGHAGTLDPLAKGLMIVGFNRGTKKMKKYVGLDKVYIADIVIGKSTDTGDAEGKVVEEKITHNADMKESFLDDALQSLVGENYYPAPMYSSVKVLGRPLYKYAREEEEPPFIPEKKMSLKSVQVLDVYVSGKTHVLRIRAKVGSGTYIRTLAEELGKKINYPASLSSLYRVSIGDYLDSGAFRFNLREKRKKYDIMKSYSLIKQRICKFFLRQEN